MEYFDSKWRGSSMHEIYYNGHPFQLEHVPPVKPSDYHTVLHQFPIRQHPLNPPRPFRARHKWDALHVRLPCPNKAQLMSMSKMEAINIERHWMKVKKALQRPIRNSYDLQRAILTYNSKYQGQWHFVALHKLFKGELSNGHPNVFFENVLPRIIRLALRLPELVQAPIPLLKQYSCRSLTLTQEQISCLLANAFLCTYPRRNTLNYKSEYSSFPDINFNGLFEAYGNAALEKIKCICHYFHRVCPAGEDRSNVPTGCVTFKRRTLSQTYMPKWDECSKALGETRLHISSEGTIEDDGVGLLQVDFADKFLGGSVLGRGCSQEEIRFVICPELIVLKLFTEYLRPNEALIMVGCERFNDYTGYGNTFQWGGDYEDNTPCDSSRRRLCHIVAIDALNFHKSSNQYQEDEMRRELNKAYVGFFHSQTTLPPGVASGNWGCGAFGGEPKLKALLQLMVCTMAERPLVYFTFGNDALRDDIYEMHEFLTDNNILVKELWGALIEFHKSNLESTQLYMFLYGELSKERYKLQDRIIRTNTYRTTEMNIRNPIILDETCKCISQVAGTPTLHRKTSLEKDMDMFSSTSCKATSSMMLNLQAFVIDPMMSQSDNNIETDLRHKPNANAGNAARQLKHRVSSRLRPLVHRAKMPPKYTAVAPTGSECAPNQRHNNLWGILKLIFNQTEDS